MLADSIEATLHLLDLHARRRVGHVRSMLAEHNFAPGNAGYIFWYDILAPVFLTVMYVATR